VTELFPGIRRVLAPNPSAFTGPGTNTYLIGTRDVVVVDPGPLDEGHLEAVAAAAGGKIAYVVVTHTHRDHSPGAAPLAQATGATLLGFDARDDFSPDGVVKDGDVIAVDGWRLDALYTPGHASNHLCFVASTEEVGPSSTPPGGPGDAGRVSRVVFSGDHIMGGSTVLVAAPDGDMGDYLDSLSRLLAMSSSLDAIVPGHGPVMDDPRAVIEGYIAHRLRREEAVLAALVAGPATARELIGPVYGELDVERHRAASRTLWAHLRKLADEGRVASTDIDDPEALWQLRVA
jgi:glyoxylase-like metal-dependent hydrolase (beta-lactamase superfamily II)